MHDIETLLFFTFFAAEVVGDNMFLCRCCR